MREQEADKSGVAMVGGKHYQRVAFFVGHIGRKTGGESLFEEGKVACAGGVVDAGCEGEGFGGEGGRGVVGIGGRRCVSGCCVFHF